MNFKNQQLLTMEQLQHNWTRLKTQTQDSKNPNPVQLPTNMNHKESLWNGTYPQQIHSGHFSSKKQIPVLKLKLFFKKS